MGEGKPSASEAGFFLSQAITFSQHGLGLHPKTRRIAMRCLPSFVLLAPLAFLYASLPKIVKTRSHYSSTQFGKMPSEVSDTSARFWKVPSEGSDGFAQFGKVPSAQFGNKPSETSDGFAQAGKYIFGAKYNVTRKFYKKHLRVYLLA